MKTVIAGTRDIADYELVRRVIEKSGIRVSQVITGRARGVDTMGELWARNMGLPVVAFPPDWDRYGKKAGLIRNVQMVEAADALIAIWDGRSRGTGHIIREAKKRGLVVYVEVLKV